MGAEAPPELARALAEPDALRVPLGPLAAGGRGALVCHALGVAALPTGVGAFIADRAEGNPFFSEQLAYALRDAGHLVVEGGDEPARGRRYEPARPSTSRTRSRASSPAGSTACHRRSS